MPRRSTPTWPARDFAAFRARWEHPQLHAVFTAHPTFLLTPAQSEAVAAAASSDEPIDAGVCVVPAERADDHARARARAGDARDRPCAGRARRDRRPAARATRSASGPSEWTALAPLPFRFASWVGYDMDGRTDIGWAQSIGFRLAEKAERLARYVAALEAIDAEPSAARRAAPGRRLCRRARAATSPPTCPTRPRCRSPPTG